MPTAQLKVSTPPDRLNGLDIKAATDTIAAIQADESLAKFRFRARNVWVQGGENRSTIRDFYGAGHEDTSRSHAFEFTNGEPPVLLGANEGANPVEFLLHALAGCVTTTLVLHATARGIHMAVTLPDDYCHLCHKDIAKDRPSHANLPFDGCTSSGCHNFHDNRALYEDFIEKHMGQPRTLAAPAVMKRIQIAHPPGGKARRPLAADDADAPDFAKSDSKTVADWAASSHAKGGVNCIDCHTRTDPATRAKSWVAKPTLAECRTCHAGEAKGFMEGKHGMRLAQEMSPMTPAMARIPMRKDAHEKTLGCATCHGAHGFETKAAAVEACESCHADDHTKAYRASTHFKLWQAELAGTAPPGSGVSCATCHLPRETHTTDEGTKTVLVQHNQNVGLRPSEKMIRPVCMSCHGYEFSVDALADKKLVAANFKGDPARKIESTAWVKRRLEARKNEPGTGKKH